MAGPTKAQIEARLRELEQENAQLRGALETAAAPSPEPAPAEPVPSPPAPRMRGRAFLGILLIVLGTVIAPLAMVAGFASRQVSDTDTFVATLAPLSADPAVQALIVSEASAAIDQALDTDALVAELLDGVIDADSTPRLAQASELLGPLLADQARVAIRSALTTVVESDAFSTVWEQALRLTHAQLVAVMEADADGAVAIDDSGTVAIQLAPIIAELKPALVDAGFTLADSIPEVTATITVAEVPAIAKARLGYSVLTTVGDVLPWIAIVLLIVGVVVHPRRPRAVIVAGTLLLVVGAIIGGAIAIGGSVAAALIATQVPTAATAAIYGALTGEMAAVMLAWVVLGVIAIAAGLLAGRSAGAAAARRSGADLLERGASRLDARGWRPEGVPAVLRRHGWLLWPWLGAILVLLLVTMRPLSPWDVVLGSLILAAAAALFGVLRGGTPEAAEDPEDVPAV
ncbi:hypothetical protein QQX10_01155 [Demequina sp. SYSU T00039]|uniref:Integral membrane protein n=1 Tax=Demequina lignilytica TaxID=3051663 RepID=A0AAW7M7C5_9MICO|nr:hypothetical protein [Demequina sp. SYSU T00039]MDN4486765.1 hypothetical protein [Demequina sp. SYSU T00039]